MRTCDIFWGFVEDVDWENTCNDPQTIDKYKIQIMKKGRDYANVLNKVFSGMRERIRNKILRVVRYHGLLSISDDGIEYLAAHIVGLGREQYLHHCNQKDWRTGIIFERIKQRDYVGGFSYIFPHEYDWEYYTKEELIDEASTLFNQYSNARDSYFGSDGFVNEDDVLELIEHLHPIAAGDFNHAIEHGVRIKELGDQLENTERVIFTGDVIRGRDVGFNQARVSNLVDRCNFYQELNKP